MTKSRWNKIKVGDLLENNQSRKIFIVVGVEKASVGPTKSNRVVSIRLERFLNAVDPQQWRVLTKAEVINES